MRRIFATRRRKLAAAVVAALALPAIAIAAFIIYTGVAGSGSGTFETGTQTAAITVTGTNQPALSPNASTMLNVSATNNDPTNAHTLNTLTGSFSSSPGECASFLTINPGGISGILLSYAPSQTRTGAVQIDVGALPASCSGGTWSVSFAGTTTP